MSRVNCRTSGCPHQTLEGYAKGRQWLITPRGADGTELADGVYCWRCRRKQTAPEDRKRARERQQGGSDDVG